MLQIVEEIVNPKDFPRLIHWVEKIKDEHKKVGLSKIQAFGHALKFNADLLFAGVQGLNVIKTVVDLKGTKRFKKKSDGAESSDIDLTASGANARAHFRQMTTKTSYCQTFGDRPKA